MHFGPCLQHDFDIGEAGSTRNIQVTVGDLTALPNDLAHKFEHGIGLDSSSIRVPRIGNIRFGQTDLTSEERVRAQAIAAMVVFDDG